jgi:hypothetical protein
MNRSKKLIAFPDNLIQLVEIKSKAIGFTFGEYVRFVLANDVKNISEQFEILDEETETDLKEAFEDVKNKRTTQVSQVGIVKHIHKIAGNS